MKRDDDYFREMLLRFEARDDHLFIVGGVLGMSREEIKEDYHVQLACDAGLMIEVNDSLYRMTNAGHDYLAAVKDEGIWEQTKAAVAQTGGSATLEIIKQVAVAFLKKQLIDRTGVEI